MNPTQRAALRAVVQRLLPEMGRDGLLSLLVRRMTGAGSHPLLDAPALEPLWAQPETLGWAHQYAQEGLKEQVFARLLKRGEKVTGAQIPVVTQFFTPAWVVRFLLENSLGRLWLEMHPDSRLRDRLTCLVPQPDLPGRRGDLPTLAREIRVLDPACGAMHFGLGAYDLLASCYQEELANAGRPGWPVRPSFASPGAIPEAVLTHNLYGIDIDPAVLEVARLALRLKAGGEPRNLICATAPLGALDRHVIPAGPYHVVLTNPPYMARKSMEPALAAYLERSYPEGKGDLYTAFLQRCLEWLAPGGRVGMIAQSSFLFIGSYERLRRRLLDQSALEAAAHFGPGAFAEIAGEKVNTAAFVLRREEEPVQREGATGVWIRLLDGGEEEKRAGLAAAVRNGEFYRAPQAAFRPLEGAPFLYWLSGELGDRYRSGERLGDRVRFCRGISTADNDRFVRYWWEVGLEAIDFDCRSLEEAAHSPKRWFPYAKGGGPQRWFASIRHVLDWADGGTALRNSSRAAVRNLPFQFRPGVTYSSVTGGSLTARHLPPGALFDQSANALFPLDPADGPVLLALLNHPIARFTAGFNPTVNIVEADLNRIPWPAVDRAAVAGLVEECTGLARQLDQRQETSPGFWQPPLPDQSDLRALLGRLAEREAALERLIDEGLGLSDSGRRAIRDRSHLTRPALLGSAALREAWVSYGLSIVLGRCRPGGYGGGPLLAERWTDLAPLVHRGEALPLSEASRALERVLLVLLGPSHPFADVGRYLKGAFWRQHLLTYRRRPPLALVDGRIRIDYRR